MAEQKTYTLKSMRGDIAVVKAVSEREARKKAMIKLWDDQGRGGAIVSEYGKGLDLISVN